MTSLRAKVYLRKRKSGYTAIFYDPDRSPQQKYVTLRTGDKDIARRKVTHLEHRYTLGTFDPWKDAARRAARGRRPEDCRRRGSG